MTKQLLEERNSDLEKLVKELENKVNNLEDQNEKLQKDLDEYSMDFCKIQQMMSIMFDFMKPNIQKMFEANNEKLLAEVDSKIENAIDEERDCAYEHSLGLDA